MAPFTGTYIGLDHDPEIRISDPYTDFLHLFLGENVHTLSFENRMRSYLMQVARESPEDAKSILDAARHAHVPDQPDRLYELIESSLAVLEFPLQRQ